MDHKTPQSFGLYPSHPQALEAFPAEFTRRVFEKPDFCGPDEQLSAETIELMHRRIAERLREQFEEFSRVLFLGQPSEVDELCVAIDAWLEANENESPRKQGDRSC